MKLLIREYLSMLKESGELDALLPDLLLAMGINPLSRPMRGVRQDGVDIPAIGRDPEDGIEKLFLITAKKGDITRTEWDRAPDGVRSSINEIREGYLRNRIRPEHGKIPKKIILTTGGELKQNVEPNWINYIHEHSVNHPKYGQIEFDFWGGDKLAILIEKHLLDEYLFSESVQKDLRKTIALADQNEDEPLYFYRVVEETLLKQELQEKTTGAASKRQKALCLLNLYLSIVFHWCQEVDNLKPALLCAERSILLVWEWISQHNFFNEEATYSKFEELFFTYHSVVAAYVNKISPHCFTKDGLFGYAEGEELEYPLRTFEAIGILGTLGIVSWNIASIYEDESVKEKWFKQLEAVAQIIAALIHNNPSGSTPLYDSHAIEITLALLTLALGKQQEYAARWLIKISTTIISAYKLGRCFPIDTNSYNDLITIMVGKAPPQDKLTRASTILPMLGDWYVILNLPNKYQEFQQCVNKIFAHTNLMLWFPDETTENFLYSTNAGYKSGVGISLPLTQSIYDSQLRILRLRKDREKLYEQISCIAQGWFSLTAIASRHFRTPVMPLLWHQFLQKDNADSLSM